MKSPNLSWYDPIGVAFKDERKMVLGNIGNKAEGRGGRFGLPKALLLPGPRRWISQDTTTHSTKVLWHKS